MACGTVKAPEPGSADIRVPRSIIQLQRTQDGQKSILIRSIVFRWADRDHIKQLAVSQLSRYDINNLRSTRRFVDIIQSYQLANAPVDIRALKATAGPQVAVPLLQAIDEF